MAIATSVLVLVVSSDALYGALLEAFAAADRVIAAHPLEGALVFVAFAAGSAMLVFVASALLVPAALVAWGPTWTFALLWVGWVVGGAAAYGFARLFGRPAVARLGWSGPFARWEERIARRAPFGLVLLFQLAVPSEVPGYVLGLVRYPFWRYLAVVALGELPFAVGTVFFGQGFLERRTPVLIALGLTAIVVAVVAVRALHRRLPESANGDRDVG